MSGGQVAFDDRFLASMLGDFLDDSTDFLQTLNDNVLDLDELVQSLDGDQAAQIDAERMNEMFRAAHSLKGLSAMLGLDDINQLTHRMENVFDAARHGELDVKRNVVDVVFAALDRLTIMIDAVKEQSDETVDCASVMAEIDRMLARNGDAMKQSSAPHSGSEAAGDAPNNTTAATLLHHGSAKGKPAETLRVGIDRLDHLMNLAGQLVINKDRFGRLGDQLKDVTAVKHASQSLHSAFGALEGIASLVGQAGGETTTDVALQELANQIRDDLETIQREVQSLSQAKNIVNDLTEAVRQLGRVADGIQKSVMDIRMGPVGPLFGRFKRVIRDITRDNGKDIRLQISGENTELDKRMIDELGDPLIHMVRNAADHGIESPADRAAAGKPAQGVVSLDAFHRGNRILIQVRDDGKGLDPDNLLAKAVENGIVTQTDGQRLSRHEVLQLIWAPGFSTAEKVTEISGRGMGMDIVKSKIEGIGGTVELESTLGVGTTITIKLPLTMAILPCALTVIHDDVFAMPIESITEIVHVRQSDLASVHGELINPFVGSAIEVFRTMIGCELTCGTPYLKHDQKPDHEISGIIGLSGKAVGAVVVSLSHNVAIEATAAMLGDKPNEINADVVDAIGELTNMIAGSAKGQLEELEMNISLPNVIIGDNHEAAFPMGVTPIGIPFTCDWGSISVDVGLCRKVRAGAPE